MDRHRIIRGVLFILLSVSVISGELAAKTPVVSDPVSAIAHARTLLATLSSGAQTSRYAEVGRQFGHAVDGVRQGNATQAQLTTMLGISKELQSRAESHLKALEGAAGRDEARLEALYRSTDWDDLSFALAAFPYWGAWIELAMSEQVQTAGAKKKWLWEAKKAFRGTAVQVFRPSLVYGGWLGLGYIAMAEDNNKRARKIFETLQKALGDDTQHPLHEVVALELRLLNAKSGKVTGSSPKRKLDDREAQLLRAEAIVLFEHSTRPAHNKSAIQARIGTAAEAAARLRRVIDGGYIDRELITLILQYYGKMTGSNIGSLTPLVRAEQAFEYGQNGVAVDQYEKFFENVNNRSDLVSDHIRFRYALALFKVSSYHSAASTADRLLVNKDLDPEIKRAATKLAYVARASRQATPTAKSRTALRKSAERLIRAYPNDPEADGARLTVAQTTTDSKKAYAMINAVKSPGKFKDSLQQTQFFLVARDFTEAIRRVDPSPPIPLARQGLAAYEQLPKKQREISENLAIVLQMRALVDPAPATVIAAIDEAEALNQLRPATREGILWARLKCFSRLRNHEAYLDFLTRLASAGLESWQLEQIYPLVESVADPKTRLTEARVLLPGTTSDPAMERRFKILEIEAMLALEQYPDAYRQAKSFRQTYPKIGDGYRLLALAAAKTDRAVEADRAWRAITDRTDPRRKIWWEGMLDRIRIRSESTRPTSACEVLFDIESKSEIMPHEFKPKVDAFRSALLCSPLPTG